MVFEPRQKNKTPEAVILASFLCATVMFASSCVRGISGAWIMQALSLGFFCVMIYILVRYKMTAFRYEVLPKDEDEAAAPQSLAPDKLNLKISRRQGRRAYVTECVVGLETLTAAEPLPQSGKLYRRALRENGGGQLFKYLKNITGARKYLLLAKAQGTDVRIVLELDGADEAFAGYLRAAARYNRESKNEKQ